MEDLMAVRGISAKRLEKIRQHIVDKPVTAAAAPAKMPVPAKTTTPAKTDSPMIKSPPAKDPGGVKI